MENYSKEEFRKRYESLPSRLKGALSDPEISEKISEISKEIGIPEEQIEELAKVTGRVFLGSLPLEKLPEKLRELTLDKEKAQKLAEKLDSEIFSDYIEEIEEIYKPERPELPTEPEEVGFREEEKVLPVPEKARKVLGIPPGGYESPVEQAKKKKIEQLEKSEETKKKEELLTKKEPDEYRETVEGEEKAESPRIVKEEGRIKKIF